VRKAIHPREEMREGAALLRFHDCEALGITGQDAAPWRLIAIDRLPTVFIPSCGGNSRSWCTSFEWAVNVHAPRFVAHIRGHHLSISSKVLELVGLSNTKRHTCSALYVALPD